MAHRPYHAMRDFRFIQTRASEEMFSFLEFTTVVRIRKPQKGETGIE
jgi:hypothetical protein